MIYYNFMRHYILFFSVSKLFIIFYLFCRLNKQILNCFISFLVQQEFIYEFKQQTTINRDSRQHAQIF